MSEFASIGATSDALSCGVDITGDPSVDAFLDKLTDITSIVCIHSCYLSLLYEHSVQKFIDAQDAGVKVGAAITSFLTRVMADPMEGLSQAVVDQLIQMVELHMDSITNAYGSIATAFEDASFTDILFGMIKTILARYGKQIVMAAVQDMVKQMEGELKNRSDLLYALRVSLDSLEMDLSTAAHYEWWDEFVKAVQLADAQLRDASQSLATAYDSTREGNWDIDNLERGQLRLAVAYQKLASVDDISDLVDEFIGDFRDKPYLPFDSMFRPVEAAPLWGALDNISATLKTMIEDVKCLNKTTLRLQQLRGFIMAAEGTMKWLDSQAGISMSLDIVISDALVGGVVQSIQDIQTDMRRVLEEHNRLVAPISLGAWKSQIKSQMEILKLLNITKLPKPWGMDAYGEEGTQLTDLQALLHSTGGIDYTMTMDEWDFSATFATDVLASIIRSSGDIISLISDKPQWNSNMERAKSIMDALARKDAEAATMLHAFSGHEDSNYDYVLQLLESAGMMGAVRSIERGMLVNVLQSSAMMATSVGGALACLSSMFGDRAGMSIETQAAIDGIFDAQFSDAKAMVRSLNTLPSLQLRSLSVLQMQIDDVLNEMAFISNLAEGGC